jgi:hypothetical protein
MRSIKFAKSNLILTKPQGYDNEKEEVKIDDLAAYKGDDYFVTYWKPSPEELTKLLAGQAVRLDVLGQAFPPVAVNVEACDEAEEEVKGTHPVAIDFNDPNVQALSIYNCASRLRRLLQLNAPAFIVEKERRLILKRVNSFPVLPEVAAEVDRSEAQEDGQRTDH